MYDPLSIIHNCNTTPPILSSPDHSLSHMIFWPIRYLLVNRRGKLRNCHCVETDSYIAHANQKISVSRRYEQDVIEGKYFYFGMHFTAGLLCVFFSATIDRTYVRTVVECHTPQVGDCAVSSGTGVATL